MEGEDCHQSSKGIFMIRSRVFAALERILGMLNADSLSLLFSLLSSEARNDGGKAILVILVGAPGSGKTTFCDHVMKSAHRPWTRICQVSLSLSLSSLQ